MFASIAPGFHWLTTLPPLMQRQSSPLTVLSILTITNVAILALNNVHQCQRSPNPCVRDPVDIWLAGNASIVLWTLCWLLIHKVPLL